MLDVDVDGHVKRGEDQKSDAVGSDGKRMLQWAAVQQQA
jgi:hypothetical protein